MKIVRNLSMALIGIASTGLAFMSFQSKSNEATIGGQPIALRGSVVDTESLLLGSSYTREDEYCYIYGYICYDIVIKCRMYNIEPCDVSDQIPCAEICFC